MQNNLEKRLANGGSVCGPQEDGYTLSLPVLPAGTYGLAQLDDYMHLPRSKFPYQPPCKLELEARISDPILPGTWGFGFWNDPFSFGFGGGGMKRVLPVLPNAAWFFYGSPENYLSLRDDQPGAGFLAQTFRSPRLPSLLSVLALPGLPFLFWPAAARLIRRLAQSVVKEDTRALSIAVESWHIYSLEWSDHRVVFSVDAKQILSTEVSPQGNLGFVVWIDNQYFRFDPTGKIGFGFLPVLDPGWLQSRHLSVTAQQAN